MYISLTPTLILLIIGLATFLGSRWRLQQPIRPERGPRLIPWTLVAMLSGTLVILMLINLGVLAGLDTNRPG